MTSELGDVFLVKALESLAGAESEFANKWYNNCANRCYYACFPAAIAAPTAADIRPPHGEWGHDFMRSQCVGLLINRRKVYPSSMHGVISVTAGFRITAGYQAVNVSVFDARRVLRNVRSLVRAVEASEGLRQ